MIMLRIFLWFFFINVLSFVSIVAILTMCRVCKIKVDEYKILNKIGENITTYEVIILLLTILFGVMDML